MPINLSKLQVFGKIALALLISLVAIYSFSALFTVNNRVNYNLSDTTWVSRQDGTVTFTNGQVGKYHDELNEVTGFTYTHDRGFVICTLDDEVVFEFITINDARIYSVNMNVMFYSLESLTND